MGGAAAPGPTANWRPGTSALRYRDGTADREDGDRRGVRSEAELLRQVDDPEPALAEQLEETPTVDHIAGLLDDLGGVTPAPQPP